MISVMISLPRHIRTTKMSRERSLSQSLCRFQVLGLISCLTFSLSLPAAAMEPDAPSRLIEFQETIGYKVQEQLRRRSGFSSQEGSERKALAAFYRQRGNQPVWVERTGLSQRALKTIDEIRNADQWALPAGEFRLPDMAGALDSGPMLSARLLANAELTLSLAILKYARFARGGRTNPARISKNMDRKLPLVPSRTVMEQVSAASDPAAVLRGYNPQHRQFLALRREYLAMTSGQLIDEEPQHAKLPKGPTLKKGMTHKQVALLRNRLGMKSVDPWLLNIFDSDVDDAVRAYQKSNGLNVDGAVGPGTRATMNGDKIKGDPAKLLANLEQWRWMPADMGNMHIWVNIPEYKIRVIKDGKIIHTERVVVGKTVNQTPIFSKNLKWIEFHPSWYVPQSIKIKEIAPGVRRGGSAFLKRQGLVVSCPASANKAPVKKNFWGEVIPSKQRRDIRYCSVKQPPGPKNVLGVVKFKFPNKHSVYLHDTTSKSLFNKRVRAYSHGCIRVRDPLRLAAIILEADQGITRRRIQSIIDGPRVTHQSYLKKGLPVHITYFTATADRSGKVRYFKDIYGHEKRIALALKGDYGSISPVPNGGPARASVRTRLPKPKKKKNLFDTIFGGFTN